MFPQVWSSSTVFITRLTRLVLNRRTGNQHYPVLLWKLHRQVVVFPVSVTFALHRVVSWNRCLGKTISLDASTSSQDISAWFTISSHSEITVSSPANEKVKPGCHMPPMYLTFSSGVQPHLQCITGVLKLAQNANRIFNGFISNRDLIVLLECQSSLALVHVRRYVRRNRKLEKMRSRRTTAWDNAAAYVNIYRRHISSSV